MRDGVFNYTVEAEDVAGNAYKTLPESIQVDRTPPVINSNASLMLFSPNRDGIMDDLTFMLEIHDASPLQEWKLEVKNKSGKITLIFSHL